MKKFVSILVAVIMMIVGVSATDIPQIENQSVSLYVNDEKLDAVILANPENNYQGYHLESFVPVIKTIEKLGLNIKEEAINVPITSMDIEEPVNVFTITGGNNIAVILTMSEDYFIYYKYNDTSFKKCYNHGYGSGMTENGVAYMVFEKLADMIDAEAYQKGNDIYISTYEYYDKNVSLNDEMGHLIEIDVYINDIKILTPVYKNRSDVDVEGPNDLGAYVLLAPVYEALGAVYEVSDDAVYLILNEKRYEIPSLIIDKDIFVEFSSVRYAINGSLSQNDYDSMRLYSEDYERLDIPATLEEAYIYFDENLEADDIEYIKNLSEDDIIEMHFGLGMWIRNNWLYPSNSKIAELFINEGFGHPDEMSHFILVGYHYYLNNSEYTIEMYKDENQEWFVGEPMQKSNYLFILIFSLIFIFIAITVVLFLRRRKRNNP